MSSYKAIATVTATLRYVLETPVQSAVAGATITAVRPDASGTGLPTTGVNLFLFQVTPNAALRNADAPTRRPDGTIVKRPSAAVDLHYLFSFYGADAAYETQRLLGAVVAALQATPSLSRAQITAAIADPTLTFLADSDLASALDLVRFTPTALTLDEFSNLWSVFLQTPYVLSIAYRAGPVLLDEEVTVAAAALPVKYTPRVHVLAPGSPLEPGITQVLAQATSAAAPAPAPILVGYTLVLEGNFVGAAATRVLIDGNAQPSFTATGKPITLVLSSSLGLRAGLHNVQVVQELATGQAKVALREVPSNMATFVLQPTINSVTTQTSGSAVSVAVSLTPKVGAGQRVRLLLDELNAPATRPPSAYGFVAPLATADDVDPFPIPISGVPSGTYLVRVQVDGAESVLTFSATSGYTGPTVTL